MDPNSIENRKTLRYEALNDTTILGVVLNQPS